ncbi:MAG: hypothetical protein Q8R02_06075 [Hyphomonadaceae bacterium]|nr:hypothetical protein [Hyphomonadaceae bacterium]
MSAILITGARAPIALDLARSFEAAGHEVHLADSITPWGARLTRRTQGRLHRFAPPRFAFTRFAADLGALVDRLDARLVIPTCEEVFYVAEAAARRGFADRIFAPSPSVLKQLHSKVEFAGLARRAGVCAPVTSRLISKLDLAAWRERSSSLVFKPEFSRFASHTLVRPAPHALDRLAPTPSHPWAVQEFVEGEEICVWSAARAGEVVAFAAYRPRWRQGGSASFYFETDTDPKLLAMAQTIARAANATGHLSYDVIRAADGTLAPIECNPRGVSGLHLFDASPRLAQALLGETSIQLPEAMARHLGPAMWMLGAPQAVAAGRLGEFTTDLKRSRDVLAAAGPWAGMGALMDAARFAAIGLSRGRSASGQSTDDIEWNGEPIP